MSNINNLNRLIYLKARTLQHTSLSAESLSADGGEYFSMVLKEDGTVWAWGRNDYGQLGIGKTENQAEPVRVSISSAFMHCVYPGVITS